MIKRALYLFITLLITGTTLKAQIKDEKAVSERVKLFNKGLNVYLAFYTIFSNLSNQHMPYYGVITSYFNSLIRHYDIPVNEGAPHNCINKFSFVLDIAGRVSVA